MKATKFLLASLIIFGFLCSQSCNDDEQCTDPTNRNCENYDPCLGMKTVNTFFKVSPGDRGFPAPQDWCELKPCDTLTSSSVVLEVPNNNPDNCTYEWLIGDESEPRIGDKIEIDFSEHLNSQGWETYVSISLTIRTPWNFCLENEADTFIVVTRDLFFTEKSITLIEPGSSSIMYKGHFTSTPVKESIVQFIQLDSSSFWGIQAPLFLTVGLPFIDTLVFPQGCSREFCSNYIHTKRKTLDPERCNATYHTNYLSSEDWIFLDGNKRIERRWEISPPPGVETFRFIGQRL
ncbi:MAG: hypothetical protein ACI9NN_001663 [Bacteroidia bacterium]|jgi:hypothetical protein